MARAGHALQARIAEKLTILNERGEGLITRLYDIKKTLANADTRPLVFGEKSLENVIKGMDKKFNPSSCNNQTYGSSINTSVRTDILKSLHQHYFTLVDILEFKDNVSELLVIIDANQIHFDIAINFDLTKRYLDLITLYVSLMIILSRVEDRKPLLGLYNVAHEQQHTHSEQSFPRLAQMMIDYDPPIKKMSEEFVPHVKSLTYALLSLKLIYQRRDLPADQWRASQYLSIIAKPANLLDPARSETMPCEYLSIDVMQRWVILGFLLIHQQLADSNAVELWRQALSTGWVIQLWRDEVLQPHTYIEKYFDRIKGYERRAKEIKDLYHHKALIESVLIHKERRKFLRMMLREMNTLFTDQPGLLGPKALLAFVALSHARDEVQWLLRHCDNQPQRSGKSRANVEDLNDRQLPELLFYIEELRGLIKKYSQVLQRYYVQYLKGFDLAEFDSVIANLHNQSDDESSILSSVTRTLNEISLQQVEAGAEFDFTGLRLDWVRLQALTSVARANLPLREHRDLAKLLNTLAFHTKMVDYLDEILNEVSDLSIYCFHTNLFEQQFRQCMEFPAQHRYSVAFPMICSHFLTTVHDLCPEERMTIGQTSVQYCNWFLKEMSDEVNQVITAICEEQVQLSDKTLPKHCIQKLLLDNKRHLQARKKPPRVAVFQEPGEESKRKYREDFTKMDKLHMALTELCYALNYSPVIHVWGHGFVPREFFIHSLEGRFNKALPGMLMYSPDSEVIAKPSEVLSGIRAMMDVLQTLENYIHVDISRIFNNVLLQQTQPVDGFTGEHTITHLYTNWYLEVLLKQVSVGHIIYSPLQKAFVSLSSEERLSFSAEEFSDVKELRALAELLGPYGMRFMGEQIMYRVALQIKELKLLVIGNKAILTELRTSFDKPDQMVELTKKLENADAALQRLTIIGVLLSFRRMLQEVLYDSMLDHCPFLMSSIKDFSDNVPGGSDKIYINEMAASAGFECAVDPLLVAAIRNQKPEVGESEYNLACLLMVFIAIIIPRRASILNTTFEANLEGHANNTHCIGRTVNQLAQAMFLVHSRENDVEDRLKEFLALASSSLLRLGQENEKEAIRTRESVYLLLHIVVQESNVLSMDLLESCFPYALIRNAYSAVINNTHGTAAGSR